MCNCLVNTFVQTKLNSNPPKDLLKFYKGITENKYKVTTGVPFEEPK